MKKGDTSPVITVGVMVYNESKHIINTLNAITQQKTNFSYEILVADNCSNDGSSELIDTFIKENNSDVEIRYFIHDRNIGAIQNYNYLIRNSKGRYFTLAGGHDLWSDNFLDKLCFELEQNPNYVIAYGDTKWIDTVGQPIDFKSSSYSTNALTPVARFAMSIAGNQHAMYGMFRLESLLKTRLQLEMFGSGAVLLGELSIIGEFCLVPEVSWVRRANRKKESQHERITRYKNVLYAKKRKRLFPHWRIPLEYLKLILRSECNFTTKLQLLCLIPFVFAVNLHLLVYDFKVLFSFKQK